MSDKNGNINKLPENIEEKSKKNEEKINQEDNSIRKVEGNSNNSQKNIGEIGGMKYTILRDDHPIYDLSFKIIIIGDSGKY